MIRLIHGAGVDFTRGTPTIKIPNKYRTPGRNPTV